MQDTINGIRYWHRRRCFTMEQRKRAHLALASFMRLQLGWSRALPESERSAIRTQALAICAGNAEAGEWAGLIDAAHESQAPFDGIEKQATKEMERLAKSLPAWEAFGAHVNGFGPLGLAIIVGEAGDLSAYSSKSKLWKRMGLALVGGVRQGGLTKTAPAADWIEHGYNRERRSRMWTIGDSLKKKQSAYREVYLARKAYERERAEANGLTVAEAAKIPKKRAGEFISLGHIDRRAQRYMEKRLLRDLWNAWRGRCGEGRIRCADEAKDQAPAPQQAMEDAA
jgi:hypothetical protein